MHPMGIPMWPVASRGKSHGPSLGLPMGGDKFYRTSHWMLGASDGEHDASHRTSYEPVNTTMHPMRSPMGDSKSHGRWELMRNFHGKSHGPMGDDNSWDAPWGATWGARCIPWEGRRIPWDFAWIPRCIHKHVVIAVLGCVGCVRCDTKLLQRSLSLRATLECSLVWCITGGGVF